MSSSSLEASKKSFFFLGTTDLLFDSNYCSRTSSYSSTSFYLLFLALLLLKFELQYLHRIGTVNFLCSVNVVTLDERVDLVVLLLFKHLIDLSVQEVEDGRVLAALDGTLQFHFGFEVLQV